MTTAERKALEARAYLAELKQFMGEQHGKLRRASTPCKHGDCPWEANAVSDERWMDNHSRDSVRPLPPSHTEIET